MSATVTAADLADFVTAVLVALDVPEADAATVAGCLVAAELEGHASHGVIRLPFYASRLRLGLITPRPRFTVTRTRPAAVTLDAGNALGPVAATRAMDLAAEAAAEAGLGMCAVRASNHIGALGAYVRRAADAGLIGLALTNTPPALAPPGGREPYLGTNPVAAAVPTSHHPLVIDLATSQTARGRILSAARTGDPIPPGWALDADGRPTTDPGAALEGSLAALGGAKGFALALLVEVLAGVLPGAGVGPEVSGTFAPSDRPSNVGHCLMAIDPGAFGDGIPARVDALCQALRSSPAADPAAPVRVPGDRPHQERLAREAEGITLPDPVVADLGTLAGSMGLTPLA